MTTELHCSTCDAIIAPGSQKCPGCGLQLTTQAAPAVYIERGRFPLWGILLVAIAGFVIFANILGRHDEAKAADAKSAFTADLESGQLDTAAAFEARCGEPRWTKQTDAGQEMHYFTGESDYFVTLRGTQRPLLEFENTDGARAYRTAADPAAIFQDLHCK